MSNLNNFTFFKKKKGSVFFIMVIVIIILNIVLTSGMLAFYQVKSIELKAEAVKGQQNRAKEIANHIENYVIRAQQLSDSAVSLLSTIKNDRLKIEDTLEKLLLSATDESVYGLGIWFEPYQFDATQDRFGPYAHKTQSPNKPIVLTYEWSDYNYFARQWYLSGKAQPHQKTFNEPYYEKEIIWMTLTQGFLNEQDEFSGVVCIDMTLQTLLELLKKIKTKPDDHVYITTQQNTLFVHPEINQLLDFVRQERPVANLLDIKLADLKNFEQQYKRNNQVESSILVEQINWEIHIATEQDILYKDIYVFRNTMISNVFSIWLASFFILLLLVYFGRQAQKARLAQEHLEQQLLEQRSKEIALKELNSLLEIKVAERTEALHQANTEITALNERLKSENLRMSSELEITQRLQELILPRPEELTAITDLDIASFMKPATEVGGDYYDVLIQDKHIKIAIGDITGHGLESGMLMLMTQMAVRTLFNYQVSDVKAFFNVLNKTLCNNIKRMNSDKNLTLLMLDYYQGQVRLSGQHEFVLWVHADATVELIDTLDLGFMVGVVNNISRFVNYLEFTLAEGEGLVLYTDGITEAYNTEEQMYGVERLCQIVSQHWLGNATEIKQAIIEDFYQHIQTNEQADDITLVVLKR